MPGQLADAVEAIVRTRVEIRRTTARANAAERPWATTVATMLAIHHDLGDEERPSASEAPTAERV